MKYVVCSVFDSKVNAFSSPFCCKSRGEAIRSFTDACRDDSLPFKRHPTDYRLFILAEFDDQSGVFLSNGVDSVIGADELGTV